MDSDLGKRSAIEGGRDLLARDGWKRERQEIVVGYGEHWARRSEKAWHLQPNPTLYRNTIPRCHPGIARVANKSGWRQSPAVGFAISAPMALDKLMEDESRQNRVLVSWSGGKDSCLALHEIQRTPGIRVEALLTTVTRDFDRISMHGVRRTLLERQAASLGLSLHQILISKDATNEEYESKMGRAFSAYHRQGIGLVVFGDLFLEDIRAYRERLLAKHDMIGLYPIWKRDTSRLIREFIQLGFKTVVVCVDPAQLDPSFVGRIIDENFLSQLPPQVDPCGENGEFHTFVFDGPIFRDEVKFSFGEITCRGSFWFCDLLPEG